MSFLGDLVNSIGSDSVPLAQPKPFQRQNAVPPLSSSKSVPKAAQAPKTNVPSLAPTKARVDDNETKIRERSLKTNGPPLLQIKRDSRPSTPSTNGTKPMSTKTTSLPPTPATATSAKLPPKGSYADIMARAKQAQEQRSTSQVGLIKHQATSKEKVSKVAERRREEQERLKGTKVKLGQHASYKDRPAKRRSVSPVKKDDQSKVPKISKPYVNVTSSYKGTIGTASKRSRDFPGGRPSKRSKYDEYLGTDEEDEGDMEDDDEDGGYGSEQSSDMEAGWDELEGEEALALHEARRDDARELALESKLKNEKEERRRKLTAMAKRIR